MVRHQHQSQILSKFSKGTTDIKNEDQAKIHHKFDTLNVIYY
jgi:hypothetical protein